MHSLQACADHARTWLFQTSAPLWLERGWHSSGMFVERLDRDGQPDRVARRLMVQARQIFSYCELGRLGWTGPWREHVEAAIAHILAKGRGPEGFFIHTFSPEGEPADTRADLYDQAFAMFCLGHAAEVLGRSDLIAVASEIETLLDTRWRHPLGGFTEGEIAGPPRRQNPHMHMLEASSVLWRVSGGAQWSKMISEIVSLSTTRFIDVKTGALTEYFENDWAKVKGAEGRIVEPGHCFEWAWLLENLQGDFTFDAQYAERLIAFARKHGICSSRGVAINEINLDGQVVQSKARLWPQTERLKVAVTLWGKTGKESEAAEIISAYNGLRRYLDTPAPGLWRDKLQADGTWVEEYSPASSFYHIVCGMVEMIRMVDAAEEH